MPGLVQQTSARRLHYGTLPYDRPDLGKENQMIRTLIAVLITASLGLALTGCHAEGEVKPEHASSISVAR
jgi:hypothetical protein